jgi:hypothetical protein
MRQVNGPLTSICSFNLERRNAAIRVSVATLTTTVHLLGTEVRSLTTTVTQNQATVTNQVAALTHQVAALADQVAEQRATLDFRSAIFGGSLVFLAIGLISSTTATRKR